jgi:signal transduction histidine kinase
MTIEEVANTMSAATARAVEGLREVSIAIAELRDAEKVLKGLAAALRAIAAENREPTNSATFAHPIATTKR